MYNHTMKEITIKKFKLFLKKFKEDNFGRDEMINPSLCVLEDFNGHYCFDMRSQLDNIALVECNLFCNC